MRIILDGMGGDNAPDSVIEGAMLALREISDDIIIVGKQDIIEASLKKYGYNGSRISVVNAEEVIVNDESPVRAIRRKKNSSIVVGLNMVKEGDGDVFISAGSTGALLAGGLLVLGRVKGIDRPTLASIYPVIGGDPSLLVDAGANAECKARNLVEFAIMGSVYMEKVLGRRNPRVGLINNGTEEGKGTELTKETFKLLQKTKLNFVGNIEARELQNGVSDVIVSDGFTGNAILKTTEGMGLMMLREMKKLFYANTRTKFGAMLMKDQIGNLKKSFDYKEYGGAPILGVKGALLKAHGSSDAKAIKQTILKAIPYVNENVVEVIANSISEA